MRNSSVPFVSSEAFGRILTGNEFTKYFKPIYLAGQKEKIHSYQCNFTVDIYVFNLNIGDKKIDGMHVDNND